MEFLINKTDLSAKKAIIVMVLMGFVPALFPAVVHAQSLTGWNLVWSDEFNGTSLDTNKWKLEPLMRISLQAATASTLDRAASGPAFTYAKLRTGQEKN